MKKVMVAAAPARVASPGRLSFAMKTGTVGQKKAPTFRPNAVTVAAMKEARQRRRLPRFTSLLTLTSARRRSR